MPNLRPASPGCESNIPADEVRANGRIHEEIAGRAHPAILFVVLRRVCLACFLQIQGGVDTFTPPHCPNPACPFHCPTPTWKFKKAGFFSRLHCLPQFIQRYLCSHCHRSFSSQTFSTTYYLHQPALQPLVFQRILACSGLRQIAHELSVSHTTVMNHVARLGRHCLLFHHQMRPNPKEALVLDGFESFEFSQYFPFHFHVLVGQDSHFFYLFTDSPLRRKGRMTSVQQRRRAVLEQTLGRPDPKSIQRQVAELLRLGVAEKGALTLHTDDHPAYPRAFRQLPGLRVAHHVTSSRERRTTRNPLFPVNLLDLLIRHGGANHKRETIAFSKRRQAAIERLAIVQVWRNYLKSFSEKRRDPTPAQRLGLVGRKLTVKEVLAKRLFATRLGLPELLRVYYRRGIQTAALGVNRVHALKYAY
jgi:transposase-like protein